MTLQGARSSQGANDLLYGGALWAAAGELTLRTSGQQGLLGLHQRSVEVLAGVTGHGLVGRDSECQIGGVTDDTVELLAKLNAAKQSLWIAESPAAHHGVKVDADGMPVGADPDLEPRKKRYMTPTRELGGLARRHGGVGDDLPRR